MTQVNKKHYFRKKYDSLDRFISYFYQVDLALEVFESNTNKILEIGKGNGFFSDYMKKLGVKVTTCDFDNNLQPDIVADIRSLPVSDNSFDLVTAFEILEHIPFEDVPKALSELNRVSKKRVILSLPYRSTGIEWIFKFPGIRTILKIPFLSLFLRIPLKFGGIKVSGQHYWEIDAWRTPLASVRKLLKKQFKILTELSPPLDKYHYFFVLEI
jgi:SAM-dependent methyltransferase